MPSDFGSLIESIFKWALYLVGIAVFVNFLWAGFLWFTAAGRSGQIGQAKEKMINSLIGLIILLASYLILNTINPDLVGSTLNLPGIGGQGGGGGPCSDKGGTPNYAGNLQSAINTVIANNPDGIADLPFTATNGRTFLNLVAQELQSASFNATTSILNGNGNLNPSGDLIAISRSGDTTIERYDALIAGPPTIRQSATSGNFTGDIPLTCAS